MVDYLRRRFRVRCPGLEQGIGDDAAVLRPPPHGGKWAITTDMLIEEVDFQRDWQSAGQLGWKALAVNLSDLAAMGAAPRFFLVALALPSGTTDRWVTGFFRGLAEQGKRHGAALIGGDLSRSPGGIQITVTAIGLISRQKPAYRSGGRAGERIYVTGVLGKAAAGLQLLLWGRKGARSRAAREALRAHRMPEPRCEAGAWLARNGYVSAMMDLSDGLSTDLNRLCRAGRTGAQVWRSSLPLFGDSAAWGCDPEHLALHGGEDFELLLTVPEARARRLERSYPRRFPPLHWIGRLTAARGLKICQDAGKPSIALPALGFDHFRS